MNATLEGRYQILLFLVIYIFIIGAACTVFAPDSYTFTDEFSDVSAFNDQQALVADDWWTQATGAFSMIAAAFSIFFKGLLLDVPFVPLAIRAIMVTPVLVLLIVVLFEILLDIVEGVKNFTSIFKPLG